MADWARGLKKCLALVLTMTLALPLLGGCQRQPEKHEKQVFAMDTVMTLTIYGVGLSQSG